MCLTYLSSQAITADKQQLPYQCTTVSESFLRCLIRSSIHIIEAVNFAANFRKSIHDFWKFSSDHSSWSPNFCFWYNKSLIMDLTWLRPAEKSLINKNRVSFLISFHSELALKTKCWEYCGVMNSDSFLLDRVKHEYSEIGMWVLIILYVLSMTW